MNIKINKQNLELNKVLPSSDYLYQHTIYLANLTKVENNTKWSGRVVESDIRYYLLTCNIKLIGITNNKLILYNNTYIIENTIMKNPYFGYIMLDSLMPKNVVFICKIHEPQARMYDKYLLLFHTLLLP